MFLKEKHFKLNDENYCILLFFCLILTQSKFWQNKKAHNNVITFIKKIYGKGIVILLELSCLYFTLWLKFYNDY